MKREQITYALIGIFLLFVVGNKAYANSYDFPFSQLSFQKTTVDNTYHFIKKASDLSSIDNELFSFETLDDDFQLSDVQHHIIAIAIISGALFILHLLSKNKQKLSFSQSSPHLVCIKTYLFIRILRI